MFLCRLTGHDWCRNSAAGASMFVWEHERGSSWLINPEPGSLKNICSLELRIACILSGARISFSSSALNIFSPLSSPGRQPGSAAGKRKSMSNVWKTVWLCWKTKTRPWLKSWKRWRTFTATKASSGGCLWSRAEDGAVYTLLQQNKKKEKTLEQKLLRTSLFLCSLRPGLRWIHKCPGESEQLELASFALVLILCSLHVKTQKVSRALRFLLLSCTGDGGQCKPAEEEEQEEEIQVLPENAPLKHRDYGKKKPRRVSRVSLPASFSEVRRGAHKATQSHHQLQQGNSTAFTW